MRTLRGPQKEAFIYLPHRHPRCRLEFIGLVGEPSTQFEPKTMVEAIRFFSDPATV